jgi:hypothetical protein
VLPLLTAGRVRLIDNDRLVSQFSSLERRTSSTGRDSVNHGSGDRHDDLSNAVAGALTLAASAAGKMQSFHVPFVATRPREMPFMSGADFASSADFTNHLWRH